MPLCICITQQYLKHDWFQVKRVCVLFCHLWFNFVQLYQPTIWMDSHPVQTNWCPHLCHPHHFYTGCPSLHNPANLSWLATGTKYAGLHTRWLGASACVVFILLQKIQKVAKCTFWYRLTRVVPDRVQGDVKWLCVVCLCNCISTLITAVLFEFLGRCNDCLQSYDAVGQHWNCPATDLERFPSGSSGKKKLRQK